MEDEITKLRKEIDELEAQLEPKQRRLNELYRKQGDEVEERVQRAYRGEAAFTLDELRFAATNRCSCGAGLAYPKNIGMHGAWDCSDILLGRALPKDVEESKSHISALPFSMYEIKSEDQPSANGATTRPVS